MLVHQRVVLLFRWILRTTKIGKLSISHSGRRSCKGVLQRWRHSGSVTPSWTGLNLFCLTLEWLEWVISSKASCKLHRVAFTKIDHWKTMENHGKPWKTMENHGKPWKTMENHGKPWKTMENHQHIMDVDRTVDHFPKVNWTLGASPAASFGSWAVWRLSFRPGRCTSQGGGEAYWGTKKAIPGPFGAAIQSIGSFQVPKKRSTQSTIWRCQKSWPMSANSSLAGKIFDF